MKLKFILLIFLPLFLIASNFEGIVKSIENSNTVLISNKDGLRKIRLYGTKPFVNNKQAVNNSKNYLGSLIGGKTVKVRQVSPITGIIILGNMEVNLNMVENGFLLSNSKESNIYFAIEQQAKNQRLGNWSFMNPINNNPYNNCNNCYNCNNNCNGYCNGSNCNYPPPPRPKPPICNGNNCNYPPPPKPPICNGNNCNYPPNNGLSISVNINGSYSYFR